MSIARRNASINRHTLMQIHLSLGPTILPPPLLFPLPSPLPSLPPSLHYRFFLTISPPKFPDVFPLNALPHAQRSNVYRRRSTPLIVMSASRPLNPSPGSVRSATAPHLPPTRCFRSSPRRPPAIVGLRSRLGSCARYCRTETQGCTSRLRGRSRHWFRRLRIGGSMSRYTSRYNSLMFFMH